MSLLRSKPFKEKVAVSRALARRNAEDRRKLGVVRGLQQRRILPRHRALLKRVDERLREKTRGRWA